MREQKTNEVEDVLVDDSMMKLILLVSLLQKEPWEIFPASVNKPLFSEALFPPSYVPKLQRN
jgi:hypothetical protein